MIWYTVSLNIDSAFKPEQILVYFLICLNFPFCCKAFNLWKLDLSFASSGHSGREMMMDKNTCCLHKHVPLNTLLEVQMCKDTKMIRYFPRICLCSLEYKGFSESFRFIILLIMLVISWNTQDWDRNKHLAHHARPRYMKLVVEVESEGRQLRVILANELPTDIVQ